MQEHIDGFAKSEMPKVFRMGVTCSLISEFMRTVVDIIITSVYIRGNIVYVCQEEC